MLVRSRHFCYKCMEKERSGYATFSFDKETQSYDEYMRNKYILEKGISEFESSLKKLEPNNEMFVSGLRISTNHTLTICGYKDRVFVGMIEHNQKTKTTEFQFDDKNNLLADINKKDLEYLFYRSQNVIDGWEKDRQIVNFLGNQNPRPDLKPVLNKIVEFEDKFSKMPEKTQEIAINSGMYNQKVDHILGQGLDYVRSKQQAKEIRSAFGELDNRIKEVKQESIKLNKEVPAVEKPERNSDERCR